MFGYGLLGELRLDEPRVMTDLGMVMGAFGARGTLLAADRSGGLELAAQADGLLLPMNSEAAVDPAAAEADWALPDATALGAAHGPRPPSGLLNAELSYGFGDVTPYAGVSLAAAGERLWRLGGRTSLAPRFDLSVEATRRELTGTAAAATHALDLEAAYRW